MVNIFVLQRHKKKEKKNAVTYNTQPKWLVQQKKKEGTTSYIVLMTNSLSLKQGPVTRLDFWNGEECRACVRV